MYEEYSMHPNCRCSLSFPTPSTVKVGYLDKVTFDVVRDALIEVYALHRADPGYLFMSLKSYAEFKMSMPMQPRMTGLVEVDLGYIAIHSPATGKRVEIVPLPHFDDHMVILGFLE